MPDLINALVAEWNQVPAAMFQNIVESLPRRVEPVVAAKGGPTPYYCPRLWNEMCPHTFGHVVYVTIIRDLQVSSKVKRVGSMPFNQNLFVNLSNSL